MTRWPRAWFTSALVRVSADGSEIHAQFNHGSVIQQQFTSGCTFLHSRGGVCWRGDQRETWLGGARAASRALPDSRGLPSHRWPCSVTARPRWPRGVGMRARVIWRSTARPRRAAVGLVSAPTRGRGGLTSPVITRPGGLRSGRQCLAPLATLIPGEHAHGQDSGWYQVPGSCCLSASWLGGAACSGVAWAWLAHELIVRLGAELVQFAQRFHGRDLGEIAIAERDAHEYVPERLCPGEPHQAEVGQRLLDWDFGEVGPRRTRCSPGGTRSARRRSGPPGGLSLASVVRPFLNPLCGVGDLPLGSAGSVSLWGTILWCASRPLGLRAGSGVRLSGGQFSRCGYHQCSGIRHQRRT
jgi:hypothetical protein